MEKITTQTPEKLHDENYWLMILAYFSAFLILKSELRIPN